MLYWGNHESSNIYIYIGVFAVCLGLRMDRRAQFWVCMRSCEVSLGACELDLWLPLWRWRIAFPRVINLKPLSGLVLRVDHYVQSPIFYAPCLHGFRLPTLIPFVPLNFLQDLEFAHSVNIWKSLTLALALLLSSNIFQINFH